MLLSGKVRSDCVDDPEAVEIADERTAVESIMQFIEEVIKHLTIVFHGELCQIHIDDEHERMLEIIRPVEIDIAANAAVINLDDILF
jgi:hypothetical protein